MSTLLQKAQVASSRKPRRKPLILGQSELFQECELAIAFLGGEIKATQACAALDMDHRAAAPLVYRLMTRLRDGVKAGIVKISLEAKQ